MGLVSNHLHDFQLEAGAECSAFSGYFTFPQSVDFPPIDVSGEISLLAVASLTIISVSVAGN